MSIFFLIETMRFEPGQGILRRSLHGARLSNSARIFSFPGVDAALAALDDLAAVSESSLRLRLELFPDGRHEMTSAPFASLPEGKTWRARIATSTRLSSSDPKLRHKTSDRTRYQAARAEFSPEEADEVLLTNEKGELCEGTITSLFVDDGHGLLLTPPISSGCLAGVLRTSLICAKKARVAALKPDDIAGRPFYLGNSLRGLIPAILA